MAQAVDGALAGWGDASRQFRTTNVTVKDFRIQGDGGEVIAVPEMKMQVAVANGLRSGARGRFYLSTGGAPRLFGVRLDDGTQAFDGNDSFDVWMVAIFYLVLGVAFFWTLIGIVVAWLGWKIVRQIKDAKRARLLFDADG